MGERTKQSWWLLSPEYFTFLEPWFCFVFRQFCAWSPGHLPTCGWHDACSVLGHGMASSVSRLFMKSLCSPTVWGRDLRTSSVTSSPHSPSSLDEIGCTSWSSLSGKAKATSRNGSAHGMVTTGHALSLALLGQLARGQLYGLGLDGAWVCCMGGSIALNLFGHHCQWGSKKTRTSPVPGAADSLWQVHCPTKAIVQMAPCLTSEGVLDCVSSSALGGKRRMNQRRGPGACLS